jgi:tetratricopeptide (TPR) repeat protein
MAEEPREPNNEQISNPPLTPEAKATWGATLIAAFSALISLVALGIGLYSAHLVEQQNSNSQQQALLSLVTDIQQGQAPGSTNGNVVSAELTVLGEAEEASSIINDSLRSGASSVEKYIVGRALENGDDYQPALKLLKGAAQQASDPRTAADAWRAVAAILYTLKLTSQAEGDVNRAKESFGRPDIATASKRSNVAYTDLFDIPYRVFAGCATSQEEWNEASYLIRHNRDLLNGSNSTAALMNAGTALAKTCHVSRGTLKEKTLLKLISP